MRLLPLLCLLLIACSPRAPQPSAVGAVPPTATIRPTAVPKPTAAPTNTPQPDYRSMRTRLLTPLGALIVATRGNDRTQAAAHLADFKRVGDDILPTIERDVSKQANSLHSAITNVPANPSDLNMLEQTRRTLLADIP